jgi:hypothetical protein
MFLRNVSTYTTTHKTNIDIFTTVRTSPVIKYGSEFTVKCFSFTVISASKTRLKITLFIWKVEIAGF